MVKNAACCMHPLQDASVFPLQCQASEMIGWNLSHQKPQASVPAVEIWKSWNENTIPPDAMVRVLPVVSQLTVEEQIRLGSSKLYKEMTLADGLSVFLSPQTYRTRTRDERLEVRALPLATWLHVTRVSLHPHDRRTVVRRDRL